MTRLGHFRYIKNKDVGEKLYADCWKWAADLGPTHGLWSTLLWWCCGDCKEGEAP
jgi:hypothetical protein